MTPHDRAVAWLDAHPGVETTVAERAWNGDRGKLAPKWEELGGQKKSDLAFEVENTLVAFLTSPLPCAICGGELFGDSMSEVGVPGGEIAYAPCAACGGHLPDTAGSGTAGILLDQLEARYEQVVPNPSLIVERVAKAATPYGEDDDGFVSHYLLSTGPVHAALAFVQQVKPGQPVFRKLPSPEEE